MSGSVELIKKAKKTQSQDSILDVAHDLENIESREKAEELAHSIVDMDNANDFQLGGVFSVIQANNWFEGHKNFKSYVEEVYGIRYQKAIYCMTVYKKLVNEGISWDDVKSIGWTKLSIITPVITKENVSYWVGIAGSINCDSLRAKVKAAQSGEVISEDTPVTTEIVKMAFTVHLDQKETIRAALEKAKAEVNTEFDTVALENICVGYLGGSVAINTVAAGGLKEAMQQAGWQGVLEMFGELFPDVNLTVDAP